MRAILVLILAMSVWGTAGCLFTVKHEIEPIYATLNINLRIQRELEDVFDYEESRAEQSGDSDAPVGGTQ
jgi:hypothetical protein